MTIRSGGALAALVLAVGACASGADESAADRADTDTTTTTERETTTTAPPTPDEAFLDAVDQRMTFGEPGGREQMLATGQAVCQALDTANGMYTDDAPNDSPESDAEIVDVSRDLALRGVAEELEADVTTVLLELTGEHLCPEHAATITDWLRTNGYGPVG